MARANQLNPTDPDNCLNLGMTYLELGRLGDAEKAFNLILAQNEHYAAAYDGLGLLAVTRKNLGDARRQFEKALEVNPDDPEGLLNLGILYQQTGHNQQALHYLQLFLKKAPQDQYRDQIANVRQAVREMRGQ
jgi:protein O-mannosyl-transferase